MNTYVVVGLVAIGLGLLVIIAAAALLVMNPDGSRADRPPRRVMPSVRPAAPPAPATKEVAPAPAPVAEAPQAEAEPEPGPPSGLAALPPTPEEEDDDHVNTGVLNARDFDDFEELMAAADALTKPKRGAD